MLLQRYVAREGGLYPTDPVEALRADMIADQAMDMQSPLNPVCNVWNDEQYAEGRAKVLATFPGQAAHLSAILGDKPFFHGDNPQYGEFVLLHVFDLVTTAIDKKALSAHANLEAWLHRMQELDGVKEYLASRQPLRPQPEPPFNA